MEVFLIQGDLDKDFASSTDPVFPGENWFIYWKTSSSLWKDKLKEIKTSAPLFIPINWSFHHYEDNSFDFGSKRPETDLSRLYHTCQDLGLEAIFLLPICPCPYLPNGGVPSFCSQYMSESREGLLNLILDSEYQVNKLVSFYDPNVYRNFRNFLLQLSQKFDADQLNCDIFGMRSGFISDGIFSSYLDDSSSAFERGFERYIEQSVKSTGKRPSTPQEELSLKLEYTKLIDELYVQSVQETLSDYFEGVINISFVGGAPSDLFMRSSEQWEHKSLFFKPLFHSLTFKTIPTSMLISTNIKDGILNKTLNDFVTPSYIRTFLKSNIYDDDVDMSFTPLTFFNLCVNEVDRVTKRNRWQELGLIGFLDRDFQWTYQYCYGNEVSFDESDEHKEKKVEFFYADGMDASLFSLMLKKFMSEERVCLDSTGITEELRRKLETFIRENNLNTEKLHYQTAITRVSLGEGMLVIFDGSQIDKLALNKRYGFWDNLLSFMKIRHVMVECDDGVSYYWRTRHPYSNELKFDSIRRVSFYNPTSYKKKVKIHSVKNFAFLKIIEKYLAELKSSPLGVEVHILPGGTASLDYGYFEG